MTIQKMYNRLTKLVGRIINMMRTYRETLLMVSSILVSALLVAASSLIQTFSKTNWSLPLWVIIIYLLAFVLLLASLIFAIYTVLKGINKIDKKEEAEDIEKKAKLDAIVDKLAITSEEIEAHKPKDNK